MIPIFYRGKEDLYRRKDLTSIKKMGQRKGGKKLKVRPTDEIFRRFKITEDTKERDKFFTLIQEKIYLVRI